MDDFKYFFFFFLVGHFNRFQLPVFFAWFCCNGPFARKLMAFIYADIELKFLLLRNAKIHFSMFPKSMSMDVHASILVIGSVACITI